MSKKILYRLKFKDFVLHKLSDNFSIVKAEKKHSNSIFSVMKNSGYYKWTNHTTEKRCCQYLPKTHWIVFTGDDVAVGCCGALQGIQKDWKLMKSNSARIDSLAVIPDYRKLGIAKAIVSMVIKNLYDTGFENIWVETDDFRVAAQHVYESVGFKKYNTKKG